MLAKTVLSKLAGEEMLTKSALFQTAGTLLCQVAWLTKSVQVQMVGTLLCQEAGTLL